MQAFFDLSADRQVGMALGVIPFSSIVKYAELYGMTLQEMTEFKYLIQKMDAVFLEHSNSKNKGDKK